MKPRITGMEVLPVTVSERTAWRFVRLSTNVGVSGLGEASAGDPEISELEEFYGLLGESLSIQAYRQAGLPRAAAGGVRAAAAFSAIEQALWDIRGKLLGAPVHELLGGRIRDTVRLYANINRMTRNRVPQGFAQSAALAHEAGFQAVKAAPFDGFPSPQAPLETIEAATTEGIDAMLAIRQAVGEDAAVKVDCHSAFDFSRSVSVAERLRPARLDWFEEPLPIDDVEGMAALRDIVEQRLAGGERRFGVQRLSSPHHDARRRRPDARCHPLRRRPGTAAHRPRRRGTRHGHLAPQRARPGGHLAPQAWQWGAVRWPPRPRSRRGLAVTDGPGFGIELRI